MRSLCILLLSCLPIAGLFAQQTPFQPSNMQDGWAVNTSLKGNSVLGKMDSLVSSGHYKSISSIVIAHKGQLVYEGYYNGKSAKSLHNTRSVTKTITGALIGMLI
ncbi:MAG: serine hydrolase, partial [Bacteroidota bacterium]